MKNMKIATKTAQQGDVVLKRVDVMPTGEYKVISKGKLVLAEGEVTGHYHGIEETDSELIQIGDKILMNLKNTATLTHQEHGAITIEKGIWEVGRVNEFDYFSKMQRPVAD
jgi:hypothetical protein